VFVKNLDRELYDTWDERWKTAHKDEKLTIVGRQMFKAKKKVLSELINTIRVDSIIEVGCGMGHTLQVWQDAGKVYTGIDVSRNAVNVCITKGLVAENKKLESITGHFDLVSSDGMLEHFLNFEPYARQMMRISNQYVLLIQPNYGSLMGQLLPFVANVLRKDINVYEYNYRIDDFIALFDQYGYSIKKNIPVFFDIFRVLLFEKEG
jgi:2-polyprenyl-3-methyl-5-hydroxy-6-metoxy-1,4-benzoquinol methylase